MDKCLGSKNILELLHHLLLEHVFPMRTTADVLRKNKRTIEVIFPSRLLARHVKLGVRNHHTLILVLLRTIPTRDLMLIIAEIQMENQAPGATPLTLVPGLNCVKCRHVTQQSQFGEACYSLVANRNPDEVQFGLQTATHEVAMSREIRYGAIEYSWRPSQCFIRSNTTRYSDADTTEECLSRANDASMLSWPTIMGH
eukprot:scaffold28831_cov88-Skeletonema_marinoi.AAC.1